MVLTYTPSVGDAHSLGERLVPPALGTAARWPARGC